MKFFVILFIVFGIASAGYSDTSENGINQGTAYGYSGSFAGNGPNFNIPTFPEFDFDKQLGSYFDALRKTHEDFFQHGGGAYSFSYASSSPNSKAFAKSEIVYNRPRYFYNGIQNQAQAIPSSGTQGSGEPVQFQTRGGFGGGFSSPDGSSYAFSGPLDGAAVATGSVGPSGVQQTASIFPENPQSPNVNVRFGGEDTPPSNNNFRSVFTSSSSQTTNVNGQPQTFKQAETIVNDNGKVTKYSTHS